jgi:hypothetical protein
MATFSPARHATITRQFTTADPRITLRHLHPAR